jgi:hypothetical protein
MRVFLHRVKSGGFQYALFRNNNLPVNPDAEKPTPQDKFSWRADVVCPWRDIAKLCPEIDHVSSIRGVHLERMSWGMQNPIMLYRYPIVPIKDVEGFIPCDTPPYVLAARPLPPEVFRPSPSVGFTGTTLAAVTLASGPWESLFEEFRLTEGAGPILICMRIEYA